MHEDDLEAGLPVSATNRTVFFLHGTLPMLGPVRREAPSIWFQFIRIMQDPET